MASELFLLPFRPAFDANGIVVPGAQLFFYATGTTTPQAVYSDDALTIPLANPVEANSAGVWPAIYLDQANTYRVVLKDEGGATLSDVDPYVPGVVDALAPDILEAAAQSEAALIAISLLAAGIIFDDAASGVDPVTGVDDTRYFVTWEGGRLRVYLNDGGSAVLKAELPTDAFMALTYAKLADLAASSGAGLVGAITSGTGAVAETVQTALRREKWVEQFGATGDGTTDDTTALTNFFNSAIANPGVKHRMRDAVYCFSAPLPKINVGSVWIEGAGAKLHDAGGELISGTQLKWIGTSNAGPGVHIAPEAGASNANIGNIKFVGIGINCDSGDLGTGLKLESIWYSDIDVVVANGGTAGIYCGAVSSLAEAADMQRNRMRFNCRQVEAPSGVCLDMYGTATANVSANRIYFQGHHTDTHAVAMRNTDNNDWEFFGTFCSGTATYAGVLYGAISGADAGARGERLWFLSGNKPLYLQGTADATTPTSKHRVFFRDIENGTPAPVLGTGASIDDENWYSFTPTIAATGGSGFTSGSVVGTYRRWMGVVDVRITFNCTAAGTSNTHITASLPVAALSGNGALLSGKERASTGKMLQGYVDGGSSSLQIDFYDGTYAGVTGGVYIINGSYRV